MSVSIEDIATIDKYTDVFLGNPFSPRGRLERGRAARLLQPEDVRRLLAELAHEGQDGRLEALLLAQGHQEALLGHNEPLVFRKGFLPAMVWKALPKQVDDYRAVVAAAGRGFRGIDRLKGLSSSMREVRQRTWSACFGGSLYSALQFSPVIRDHNILVLGETGTGKELVASAIQAACIGCGTTIPPAGSINAAEYPKDLVEDALFGHVKGAATGLTTDRKGAIRSADGGTLFLDEVGDLPLNTQVKLLRVIETDMVTPVGSDKPVEVRLRYVTATHRNLHQQVDEGEFRRDLFERIAGSVVALPPLRERPEDIPLIGQAYLSDLQKQKETRGKFDEVGSWLKSGEVASYAWRGNVRELNSAIRAKILGLPLDLRSMGYEMPASEGEPQSGGVPLELVEGCWSEREVVDWYVGKVLSAFGGNISKAAGRLRINRTTLRRRMRRASR